MKALFSLALFFALLNIVHFFFFLSISMYPFMKTMKSLLFFFIAFLYQITKYIFPTFLQVRSLLQTVWL